ncbi:MAG: ABC transporter ATP-binding protein [Chloroflexota bacterium]
MTGEFAIQAEKLTKRFGPVVAVDGLDLAVPRGETFGLVGPDGAGKTTTIRLLCALLRPTQGRATVAGFDTVRQPEEVKVRIGYMAQRFALYPDLSVRENLEFFSDVFNVPPDQRLARTARLLSFSRLERFQDRRAAHLSGGMQKKLALACTLVHEPEVLFLDEPTTGVDPVSRREFWDILLELRLRGVTVLVSTPYMDEAERCGRVGLLYRGRLIHVDAPEVVRRLVKGELLELQPTMPGGRGLLAMRQAREALAGQPGVLEVQSYGDLLRVFVDDAALRLPQVELALTARNILPRGLHRIEPRLEEAFISLVRAKQAADPGREVKL